MAEYVTSIKTKQGNKRIDYNALANLPLLEANNIAYDNSSTKLTATNTQAALDEILVQMQEISVGMDLSTLNIRVEKSANGQRLIFNDGTNEKSIEIPILVDADFNLSSSNPVQNKIVSAKFNNIDTTLQTIVDEYITDSDLSAKGYLTSVPSEYITEAELDKKGYLIEHQDISNKADKSTTLSGYGITDGATKGDLNAFGGTVEITSGNPQKENTVLTVNPETANRISVYSVEEVDSLIASVSGNSGSGSGATAEQLAQIEKNKTDIRQLSETILDYVFPEMYGAVGDGVTDDSEAIQMAIDEAGNTKVVYLAKKNYKISTGLVLTDNYLTFKCDGTITYDGTGSAITLTNTLRSVVDVHTIYAENGTALKLSNEEGRVTFNRITINNVRSCKKGIHLTTPNTENLNPIYYNEISFMDIIATEIGVHIDPIGYYINENRYYGGTIGGNCQYAIKIGNPSTAYTTGSNKFLSGGIEGVASDGCGIYIENSEFNIFDNIRTLEKNGIYLLVLKGMSRGNKFRLDRIVLSEIDISELGDIGNICNVIDVMTSSFDGGTNTGKHIEITGKHGFVYDTKATTNAEMYTTVNTTNFPDRIIKPLNHRIYNCFRTTPASINGLTFTLDSIYYGTNSMLKGEPIVFFFGDGNGTIKLVDENGEPIFDNTDGKFSNKTISVRWDGYNSYNGKHVWCINVMGENNLDGKDGEDGYTPQKGIDYFTTEDKTELVNSVLDSLSTWTGGSY